MQRKPNIFSAPLADLENSLPIISIVGTTATGKTDLALALATAFFQKNKRGTCIISADSRQVYKELPILTGGDVPKYFTAHEATSADPFPYFVSPDSTIELHGIGFISVTDEWSAGLFHAWIQPIISDAIKNQKLIIVVGGTGLYHRMLSEKDTKMTIPPNQELREWASSHTIEELQKKLQEINQVRLEAMNESDRQNPRRLVRAIEIEMFFENQVEGNALKITPSPNSAELTHLWYGVSATPELLKSRITERVNARFKNGALEEVSKIMRVHNLSQDLLAFSTLGLKECAEYISGNLTAEALREDWIIKELQYAKRQKTWWKQHSDITWFDTSQENWILEATSNIVASL
ncbi:MAG: hypothetical protein WAU07_01935 [Microgenomates group bacterium]